ncbi:hypothetical protein GGP41_005033 [Bipolaris sorokiniana]|uniref:Uncharacterized protein n=1 Tax=Cochliobolus sativus TaxID=45130 RepID=A0A8H6DVP3_COCSA|nr:hypothetical protein GGP41_005033 [Bipolaris sorokiniana]
MAIAFFSPVSGTDSKDLGLLRLFRAAPIDQLLQDNGADDICPVVELHPNLVDLPTDCMEDVATQAPRIRRGKGIGALDPVTRLSADGVSIHSTYIVAVAAHGGPTTWNQDIPGTNNALSQGRGDTARFGG